MWSWYHIIYFKRRILSREHSSIRCKFKHTLLNSYICLWRQRYSSYWCSIYFVILLKVLTKLSQDSCLHACMYIKVKIKANFVRRSFLYWQTNNWERIIHCRYQTRCVIYLILVHVCTCNKTKHENTAMLVNSMAMTCT